jgi:hypothetical protein
MIRAKALSIAVMVVSFGAVGAVLADEPTKTSTTEISDDRAIERATVKLAPSDKLKLKEIQVDNRLGDVAVIGSDDPGMTIHVIKQAPDGETLERLKVSVKPDPDGTIRVYSALLFGDEGKPVGAGAVRIDMTLRVPRDVELKVAAWNGKLDVSHMDRGAELTANDADITVTDVKGPIKTAATNGTQVLSKVKGTVDAGGAYGEMSLDEVSGDSLAARLHDGTIVARRIKSRTVTITTTFGDIRFESELLTGATYKLRSYKGNVTVLTGGVGFAVDAYSREGKVESRVELADVATDAHRLRGTYGARKKPALLEIQSTLGDVQVGLLNY